tara:strand:- start:483 stop:734 length:252 start_codon:yes stop_codon:yes gene_type:complete
MCKRNYEVTRCNYGYKVEVWDDYGKYTCVYEKTGIEATRFILDYWEKSEENKKSDELMHRAILNCIELDEKGGLLKGNRDGLD